MYYFYRIIVWWCLYKQLDLCVWLYFGIYNLFLYDLYVFKDLKEDKIRNNVYVEELFCRLEKLYIYMYVDYVFD